MANTGYITSSGIQQIFTTGPLSGSLVTASYANGGVTFGPIINFKQSFISGTTDFLAPCTTVFSRYYQDLINCPLNGCNPPILVEAISLCDPYNYQYQVLYNSGSPSASYTIIEYSTSDIFTSTGSHIQDNSLPYSTVVDVSDLPYLPTAFTNVYFRAYNSCSSGTKSLYSNIGSASCDVTYSLDTTMTFNTISSTLEDPQWQIYTIEGEPGTRIDYSTSNLNNGNHGGVIYMINLADYTQKNLSFINPSSGYYIIPASGVIQLQIEYSANPNINKTSFNCVGLDLTFINLAESNSPLSPQGFISIYYCYDLNQNL